LPIATFTKYPILLRALNERINIIKAKYPTNNEVISFDLNTEKKLAQLKLKLREKGGIFIL
jgi:hypothetical protein